MTKQFYLKTLKSVLGRSILHYSHHLMDRALKQSTHQFQKIFFFDIWKCLACNGGKTLQSKITKKE